jgi:hypothetical protein
VFVRDQIKTTNGIHGRDRVTLSISNIQTIYIIPDLIYLNRFPIILILSSVVKMISSRLILLARISPRFLQKPLSITSHLFS